MSSTVRVDRDLMVTTRDGVGLAADVYLPEGEGPFPTLVTRVRGSRSSGFVVGVKHAWRGLEQRGHLRPQDSETNPAVGL